MNQFFSGASRALTPESRNIKAVGLLSGGLDSMLAAKVIKDLGIEVYAVHFALPWGCGNLNDVKNAVKQVGVKLHIIPADQSYFEILKKPKHGYGSAINPCVDCHIHMIKKAAEYMKEIKAEFVFTGEVLGQRPMSQLKNSLRLVEKRSGIEGRLLRPLSAKHLEPTIPEQTGLVDREKLLGISGRGRKDQRQLAHAMGLHDFPNPAGGCLLTDKNFAKRLRDAFAHGCSRLEDTVILKWGRHFRISPEFKVIIGRDEKECETIARHAHKDDYLLELEDKRGPAGILQGKAPSDEILETAAGLVQYFSRYRLKESRNVECRPLKDRLSVRTVKAKPLSEQQVKAVWIL